MTPEQIEAWKAGYRAGFEASAEGWNGECGDLPADPTTDPHWVRIRDAVLAIEQSRDIKHDRD